MSEDLRDAEKGLRALIGSYEMPIAMDTVRTANRTLHERYGVDSPTLILVRPDGHVAYRGPADDPDALGSYLDGLFVGRRRRTDQTLGARGAERRSTKALKVPASLRDQDPILGLAAVLTLVFHDGSLDAASLEGGWRDALWFLGGGDRYEAAGLEDAVWMR